MSCRHSKYAGFVTNQDPHEPLDLNRAHFSKVSCLRPECIESTAARVRRETGEPGKFYPFGNYRKTGGAA